MLVGQLPLRKTTMTDRDDTTTTEERLVAAGRGKWSIAGVPHKGWTCVDIEDLGEPSAECEMCESQSIRYVHHMQHPQYANVLAVGCVCAGHMEGDLAASRRSRGDNAEPGIEANPLALACMEGIDKRESSYQGGWVSRHRLSERWWLGMHDRCLGRKYRSALAKKLQDTERGQASRLRPNHKAHFRGIELRGECDRDCGEVPSMDRSGIVL